MPYLKHVGGTKEYKLRDGNGEMRTVANDWVFFEVLPKCVCEADPNYLISEKNPEEKGAETVAAIEQAGDTLIDKTKPARKYEKCGKWTKPHSF